jgi:hypothetical protein
MTALCRLSDVLNAGLFLPDVESLRSIAAVSSGGNQMAAWVEVTMDERMSGKEVLSLFRRFKSLHLTFPAAGRTM